jgi:dTDP-4-amino-4,6-dideoxygalactose transaminase
MKIEVYSPTIRRKEMDAVLTAMVEEKIGVGERNRLLIQTAKEQIKFDYALALRSPAVALYLALKAALKAPLQAPLQAQDVRAGQAVVISALSPRYYYQVIEDLQLTPLYCDASFDFPCMSRETVENAVSQKPSGVEICAVVLHHTLGFRPDSKAIAELGFPMIEDVSQSYGKIIKKAAAGADGAGSGAGGANSGDVSKEKEIEEPQIKTNGLFCILGLEERDMLTSGGGALLFAMNRKDASELRGFAGIAEEYCLPDINAALAVVQFKELQRNLQKRRDIAAVYAQASLRTRHKRFIPPAEDDFNNYSFPLVLETGLKDVIAYARKKDIIVESAFENTLAASGLCGNCPVANSLALRTVLFPLYPRLRVADAERVSRLIMTLP